jgi:Mn-containing catalase
VSDSRPSASAGRGFRAAEIRLLGGWIADILDDIKDEQRAAKIQGQVVELCRRFPVYQQGRQAFRMPWPPGSCFRRA